jgi:hypothetical protein
MMELLVYVSGRDGLGVASTARERSSEHRASRTVRCSRSTVSTLCANTSGAPVDHRGDVAQVALRNRRAGPR